MAAIVNWGKTRMARMRCWLLLCCLSGSLGVQAAVPAQRVLSLNLCADQLLLALLPRERIAALTDMAADPVYSALAEQARGIPVAERNLESLLAFRPDLALATEFTDPLLLQRLADYGVSVHRIALPHDFPAVLRLIEETGQVLGVEAKARAITAELAARWQTLGEQAALLPPRRALLYRAGGTTLGEGTLEHTVLRQSGYSNIAADLGLPPWTPLSLETVLQVQPDLLILDDDGPDSHSLAEGMADHPALKRQGIRHHRMQHRNWICPSPALPDAVMELMGLPR